MTPAISTRILLWPQRNIFPLLHAIIYLLLFCWIASFFYRDNSRAFMWSAIGFGCGLLSGIVIQRQLKKIFSSRTAAIKFMSLSSIILFEAALGALLIGPLLWLQFNFIPRDNRHSICCETPLDYGANQYQDVKLDSLDSGIIAGWYVAPTTQVGKVIILIHGSGYDRRGTDFYTRLLLAEGYGVFLYDLRNHGESSGKLNTFNRMNTYQADLLRVVNYLQQKPEINPKKMAIVGISLGAFAALNSSEAVLNSFAGLWLDGLRFENFSAKISPRNAKDFSRWLFDRQTRALASIVYQQVIAPPNRTFAEIIPRIQHPSLMIVASGRDPVERETNEQLLPLLGNNQAIWFIDNAWHIGGRFEIPQQYGDRMLDFFAQAMTD